MGRREALARWADRFGLIKLMEKLPRRAALIVLNYHRVKDPPQCIYDRGVVDATPEQFDQQMGYLKSRFRVARLDEVQDLIERRTPWRHTHVLITFDDGYLDNYQVAFPILKSHGLQGTFFLPTSFIGTNRIPWWDQIAFLLRNSGRSKIVLEYPRTVELEWSPEKSDETETVIARVLSLYKAPETTDTARFLAGLESACGASLPKTASERQFMDWAEAGEMVRAGMAFGSHTHSHELLAKQSEPEQQEELRRSREILRAHLSLPIETLAYPVGSRTSVSAVTRKALQDNGYRMAFSYFGGINLPDRFDRFNLFRMLVGREMGHARFRLQTNLAASVSLQY